MTRYADAAHRLPLLSTMADDIARNGSLRSSTAAAMWTAYTAYTALTGWALARRTIPIPVATGVARVTGAALVDAGAGLCVGNEPVRRS